MKIIILRAAWMIFALAIFMSLFACGGFLQLAPDPYHADAGHPAW